MNKERIVRIPKNPIGMADVILDTDTFNEIDDQYAIAYMLHAPEKLNVKAITAAPFLNANSGSAGDGMEKSYWEIRKILELDDRIDMLDKVWRGSSCFMETETVPVISDAAGIIVETARNYSEERPLYLACIGAITNVASALLLDPSIADKIVIIWLGGNGYHMPEAMEFNMYQDIAAARVVFGSAAPIVQIPADGINDHLMTTEYELRHWLEGKTPLADYLCRNTIAAAEQYASGKPWSRVIWDIAAVAWLLDSEESMMCGKAVRCGFPEYGRTFSFSDENKYVNYIYRINRDAIFEDLFTRLLNRAGLL